MRRYESIFITPPQASEQKVEDLITKIKAQVTRADGEIVDIQKWGERPLAYEIKKNKRGKYYRLDFVADANLTEMIQRIEELYRFSDHVIRFITVKTHDDTTAEEAHADASRQRPAPPPLPDATSAEERPGPAAIPEAGEDVTLN